MRKQPTVLLSALALFVILSAGFAGPTAPSPYTFASGSKMWIEGTSTVHDWECKVDDFAGSFQADYESLSSIQEINVVVPAGAVNCDNGTMNKKMRDALKTSKHKIIKFNLKQLQVMPVAGSEKFRLKAAGQLTLAGETKPVDLNVEGERLANGRLLFNGVTTVSMPEFDIDPPTAMLGTIKAGPDVEVHFEIIADR